MKVNFVHFRSEVLAIRRREKKMVPPHQCRKDLRKTEVAQLSTDDDP